MTRPDQYDPARGTLGAWLCGVARNLARKQFAGHEDPTDPAELADDATLDDARVDHDTPLEKLLRNEAAEQVRRALARVAPHYRDVLILCELSELSYAEAAQVCGIDIGTVRSRLSRARAQLAQRLERLIPRMPRAPRRPFHEHARRSRSRPRHPPRPAPGRGEARARHAHAARGHRARAGRALFAIARNALRARASGGCRRSRSPPPWPW